MPTGNVTFTVYSGAGCIGDGTPAGVVGLDGGGVAHPSDVVTMTSTLLSFKAHYGGDTNYLESDSACQDVAAVKLTPALSTAVHDQNHAITTTVAIGALVHDSASVSGIAGLTPTGDVTFTVYSGAGCSGDGTPASTVGLDPAGVAHPSDAVAMTNAGLSFKAHYGGDANYTTADSTCENVAAVKLTPAVSTVVHDETHAITTTVAIGTLVHDSASVMGGGVTPTGSVTFTVYSGAGCIGDGTPAGTAGLDLADVAHPSDAVTMTNAGLSFKAHYGGDANYAAADSTCENVAAVKLTPALSTAVHDATHAITTTVGIGTLVHDSAIVTGGGVTPTGSVTFTAYSGAGCSGDGTPAGTAGLDPAGMAHPGDAVAMTNAGLSFKAHYGGDANYNAADSTCENVAAVKLTPVVSTAVHDQNHAITTTVAIGTLVHDSASVSGIAGLAPAGDVTFTVYSGGGCSGDGTPAGTITLVDGVAHPSSPTTITNAGLSYQAHYGGDANYNAADSVCEMVTATKVMPTLTGDVHDASHDIILAGLVGSSIHERVNVTGTVGMPTGTVTFTVYSAKSNCTEASTVQTATLSANGNAQSLAAVLSDTGMSYQVSYSGDANYLATTATCDPVVAMAFSAGSYSVWENHGPAVITVTLSDIAAVSVGINLTTTDGTASHPADYTAISETLTITAGLKSLTATIPIAGDAVYEGNRTFLVGLSGGTNAGRGNLATAPVTILDDESQPTVAFSTGAYSVAESGRSAVITVTLSGPSVFPVTVGLTTTDGTASSRSDYVAVSQTLTILPYLTSITTTVSITDDIVYETDETLTLTLSSPVSATLKTPYIAKLTILNDDPLPTAQFSSDVYSALETAGITPITVTLTAPSVFTVTVPYTTSAGTAVPGTNYTNITGMLVFTPGVTSQSINVPVRHYPIIEESKSVYLTLGNPVSATLGGTNPATLWILDTDGLPTIWFSSPTAYAVSEGGASGQALIWIRLSIPSAYTVTVGVTSADGAARSKTNYAPISTTVVIPGGQMLTDISLSVPITDDNWYEGTETLTLTLHNPTKANLAGFNGTATLTVYDNDALPTVRFASSAYSAGEGGGPAPITVTLDHPSVYTATVHYATGNGSAVAGADYLTATGTLTFTPGVVQQVFKVPVNDDAIYKGDRTVALTLTQAISAGLGLAAAQLTIIDNDSPPAAQFSAPTYLVNENAGPALLTVTISLSPTVLPVTVTVATQDGTANSTNYVPRTATLSFPPGVTQASFPVGIVNDALYGPITKTVLVTMTQIVNGIRGQPASAWVIITDDDPPPPSCATCYSFGSSDVPKPIPDNYLPGITSTLVVNAPDLRVGKVVVRIGQLSHTYLSDLRLSLVAPNGQVVNLVADPGLSTYNGDGSIKFVGFFGMILDDQAAITLNNPGAVQSGYVGRFRPDNPLSVLRGIPASGTWGLHVVDVSGQDTGTLYAWSIEFQPQYAIYLPLILRR